MRNAINWALLTTLALSLSSIAAFAHGGEDEHPPVTNQQYAPAAYPVAPGTYTGQPPGYFGQPGPGHITDPNYNPGHNNSLRHRVQDAVNPTTQGVAPGYGVPGVAQPYGYPGAYSPNQGGYLAQPGAGHINDPNYNPGHNNSLGHQLRDAISPGSVPTSPGAAPSYGYGGYSGVPAGANHVNNPYINPGHNGSVQHQMNDAVNGNQVFPGQAPVFNRSHSEHGRSNGHDDTDGHSH